MAFSKGVMRCRSSGYAALMEKWVPVGCPIGCPTTAVDFDFIKATLTSYIVTSSINAVYRDDKLVAHPEQICLMDAMDRIYFDCPRLEHPALVFRGISNVLEMSEKSPFTELGFMSTTPCMSRAAEFIGADNENLGPGCSETGAILEIILPVGTPCYYQDYFTGSMGEDELIVKRNSLQLEFGEIRAYFPYVVYNVLIQIPIYTIVARLVG